MMEVHGHHLAGAALFKQYCEGLFISLFFIYFFVFLQRHALLHSFKGSVGMDMAFVGFSPTVVHLNRPCWIYLKFLGCKVVSSPQFPTSSGYPIRRGWKHPHNVKPPWTEHSHMLVVGKGWQKRVKSVKPLQNLTPGLSLTPRKRQHSQLGFYLGSLESQRRRAAAEWPDLLGIN